ncbi:hypothetical protein FA09DRAFT_323253 [Tilletiopsis washingtonensis]|uniref:Phosphatase activator n=1 Tax=Tilletiopsis washingtonensis TaxID=58919 RepID=A0A316Z1J2_9BASI|nr:hypothetical protein FA09DRAFT_323253 [Tilletiopsis washingtonensis]PWN94838.1 hypothetical protein FA09DRAFT_323253 [Tilletiopsis washingtonensis]
MSSPPSPSPLSRLILDLRGQRFHLERDTLMTLPESVLLCLFPNGLVLSRQQGRYESDDEGEGAEAEDEEDVYLVDFDPTCLRYVLTFFKSARDDFYGVDTPSRRSVLGASHPSAGGVDDSFSSANGAPGNPLLSKQAVIVLREELEFFAIPPRKARAGEAKGDEEKSALELRALKARCGEALISRRSIFTALQRNVSKENNMAEQHLIDMLCMSGFERDDSWGFRAVEPSRCCITSIALVLLKTGISVKDDGGEIAIDQQQLATAQKLLLFWRKPARKCWWDGVDVVLPVTSPAAAASPPSPPAALLSTLPAAEAELLKDGKGEVVRVWARRVWTLELSLI